MAYQAGQKLGNYQLERFLGYGGFAEVYLGKHIYLHTQAAIKVLQRQSSAEALEKFLQEARIIAALKHPHIVGVLEFGIEEKRPFLVMAYAPHGTLRSCYNRGNALSPTIILSPIKQIADALQYAHERKIIHRDVKPDNMLLDENDTVLLSDFGLALRERGTYQNTGSTDSAGTTMYMAPEQLRGKPCAASDQYALGIVMYEWLCGCLPFDGPDISIVVQHLHEPPVPLRNHVPTLSTKVEAVVLRALAKDPKQRFADVQELARAFEEACKDIPVVEHALPASLMDTSKYGDASFTTGVEESGQESLSNEVVTRQLDSERDTKLLEDGLMPGVGWLPHYSSLQAPSLPASLDVSTSGREPVDVSMPVPTIVAAGDGSILSSANRAHISRRTMLVGIAGVGVVVLGGVGIWRFGPHEVGPLSLSIPGVPKSSGIANAVSTSNRRGSGTNGTGRSGGVPGTGSGASTSLPGGKGIEKNGIGKNNTAKPVTASKSAPVNTSAPVTSTSPGNSNNGSPAATSTPDTSGATPVATDTAGAPTAVALTVQMINPPTSVVNGTATNIAVMTNTGNISFQFEADYSSVRNFLRQAPPDIINGTTDGNGNATVTWTPTLPPGQVFLGVSADVYVTATDQNGNTVTSQDAQVQITRF